ncbi:MAG: adenylate/guanylate cyclase domain-containing protein [Methylococcaceae bacterium]|nr:adenylate/guanylate cyclase domain-containing protein [Methylococcaceae bacterium]
MNLKNSVKYFNPLFAWMILKEKYVMALLRKNACLKTVKALLSALLIGLLGALFSLTGAGLNIEEEVGLATLFRLRGALKSPNNVLIVSIDKASAEILHLPEDPEKWPRNYYAQLLENINRQNPALIAFNIYFGESRDKKNDTLLAQQIAQHKNVILSSRLKQVTLPATASLKGVSYERVLNPIAILDTAALDVAPFPIPKNASTVKQFWTYKRSAGDIATFPVSVYQTYIFKIAYAEILQLLNKTDAALYAKFSTNLEPLSKNSKATDLSQEIQAAITKNPAFLTQLKQVLDDASFVAEKKQLLRAWLSLFGKPESLYLNYFGDTGTITTVPFYQALLPSSLKLNLFQQKVVLVGYSEDIEPEMNQGFYTVYSKPESQTVSHVELAATAVANLIRQSWFLPLAIPYQLSLLIGWGVLLMAVCCYWAYRVSVIVILALSIVYGVIAYLSFANLNVWLPLFIPLAIQMPLVLMLASVTQYFKDKLAGQHLHKAFSYYLPDSVVMKLTNQAGLDALNQAELMQGVCLATDAGQYTTLSETLDPQVLHNLINTYYAVVFSQIKQHDGIISDVIGDASMAIWAKPQLDVQPRISACKAALAINAATEAFNQSQPYQLPTRLGLHYGEMRLGNVGAVDHFEYRAIGDTVNTASRIENLNKLLGTRILVSVSVINNLPDFYSREMGIFVLKGKTVPIRIFELLGRTEQLAEDWQSLTTQFSNALSLFQHYQWEAALAAFAQLSKQYPEDGPTQFYARYLQQNLAYLLAQSQNESDVWIDSEFAMGSKFRS